MFKSKVVLHNDIYNFLIWTFCRSVQIFGEKRDANHALNPSPWARPRQLPAVRPAGELSSSSSPAKRMVVCPRPPHTHLARRRAEPGPVDRARASLLGPSCKAPPLPFTSRSLRHLTPHACIPPKCARVHKCQPSAPLRSATPRRQECLAA